MGSLGPPSSVPAGGLSTLDVVGLEKIPNPKDLDTAIYAPYVLYNLLGSADLEHISRK